MNYLVEHFRKELDCNFSSDAPKISLHIHNLLELYLFLEGDVRYFVDGNSYLLKRGHLLFINNDQIHGPTVLTEATYSRCSIHFSPQMAKQISSEQTPLLSAFQSRKLLIQLNDQQTEVMTTLMHTLTNEYHHPSEIGHELLITSLLTQVLVYANNFAASDQRIVKDYHLPYLLRQILSHIQNHLADPDLSLEQIAETLNHNKIYLNRIFKRELGSTIYHYILLARISVAKKNLELGVDVQSCCYLSGFNDYSNFIRTFKKITGFSPKQYALHYQKENEKSIDSPIS